MKRILRLEKVIENCDECIWFFKGRGVCGKTDMETAGDAIPDWCPLEKETE